MHLVLHIHLVLELLQFILIPVFLLHHLNLLLEVGGGRRATAYAIFVLLEVLCFHSVVSLLLLLSCLLRCCLLLLYLVLDLAYVGLIIHMTCWIYDLISLLGLGLACGILFHFFVNVVDFLFMICRYCLCLRLLHWNCCCHNCLRMDLRLLRLKIELLLLLLILIIGILTRLCLLKGNRGRTLVSDRVLLLLTTFLAIIIWCDFWLLQLLCINLYKTNIKVMVEREVCLCPFSSFTNMMI